MRYALSFENRERADAAAAKLRVAVRVLVDPADPADVAAVTAIQDQLELHANSSSPFEMPDYDTSPSGPETRSTRCDI